MLIDSGDSGGGEDVGKLTRKRLNRGLPGRKQGTVRNQLGGERDSGKSLVADLRVQDAPTDVFQVRLWVITGYPFDSA